jgi:hypothetical protein
MVDLPSVCRSPACRFSWVACSCAWLIRSWLLFAWSSPTNSKVGSEPGDDQLKILLTNQSSRYNRQKPKSFWRNASTRAGRVGCCHSSKHGMDFSWISRIQRSRFTKLTTK